MLSKFIDQKYGIKFHLNNKFSKKVGINNNNNLKFLKSKFKNRFNRFISNKKSNKQLFDFTKENINFLKNIKSYRGSRH